MRIAISLAILLSVALFFDAKFVEINTAGAQTRGLFGNGGQASSGGGRGTFGGSGAGIGGANTGRQLGGQGGGRLNDSSLISGPSTSNDFVGTDLAELRRFIGASQASAQAGAQRVNRGIGQGFQSDQPDNQDSGPAQRKFRTRVRIGFSVVPISNTNLSERLSRTLQRTLQVRLATGTRVVIDARTAILRGTVSTNHARRLAEQLVLLEPGISRVQNEIVVTAPQDDQP